MQHRFVYGQHYIYAKNNPTNPAVALLIKVIIFTDKMLRKQDHFSYFRLYFLFAFYFFAKSFLKNSLINFWINFHHGQILVPLLSCCRYHNSSGSNARMNSPVLTTMYLLWNSRSLTWKLLHKVWPKYAINLLSIALDKQNTKFLSNTATKKWLLRCCVSFTWPSILFEERHSISRRCAYRLSSIYRPVQCNVKPF